MGKRSEQPERTGAGHDADPLLRDLGVALSIQPDTALRSGRVKTLREAASPHVMAVKVRLANLQPLAAQVGVCDGDAFQG